MSLQVVRLVERSTTQVSREVYDEVSHERTLGPLLDEGVIALVRSKSVPYGIRCGPWVGRVHLPSGRELVISEKVAGSLLDLLAWSAPSTVRAVDFQSSSSDSQHAQHILIGHFISAVEKYLASGRLARYATRDATGASPKGRIDMRWTMREVSAGKPGTIAYCYPILTRSLLANDLIALALHHAEGALAGNDPAGMARRLRTLSRAFDDCDWVTWHFRRGPAVVDALQRAIDAVPPDADVASALMYARIILLGLSPWGGTRDERLPQGLFLSLERLFEDSTLSVLKQAMPVDALRGRALGRPLFTDLDGRYIVDPDVVLVDTGRLLAVIDVKYKDLTGFPEHSDVYQVAAHAAALGVSNAFLLFPGSQRSISRLGETASSVSVSAVQVRLARLDEDLIWAFGRLISRKGQLAARPPSV